MRQSVCEGGRSSSSLRDPTATLHRCFGSSQYNWKLSLSRRSNWLRSPLPVPNMWPERPDGVFDTYSRHEETAQRHRAHNLFWRWYRASAALSIKAHHHCGGAAGRRRGRCARAHHCRTDAVDSRRTDHHREFGRRGRHAGRRPCGALGTRWLHARPRHCRQYVISGAVYTLPFDMLADLTPVAPLPSVPYWMTARKTLPANNLKELAE